MRFFYWRTHILLLLNIYKFIRLFLIVRALSLNICVVATSTINTRNSLLFCEYMLISHLILALIFNLILSIIFFIIIGLIIFQRVSFKLFMALNSIDILWCLGDVLRLSYLLGQLNICLLFIVLNFMACFIIIIV